MDFGNTTRVIRNAKLLALWPEVLINRLQIDFLFHSFKGIPFISAMSKEAHFPECSALEVFIICPV